MRKGDTGDLMVSIPDKAALTCYHLDTVFLLLKALKIIFNFPRNVFFPKSISWLHKIIHRRFCL